MTADYVQDENHENVAALDAADTADGIVAGMM